MSHHLQKHKENNTIIHRCQLNNVYCFDPSIPFETLCEKLFVLPAVQVLYAIKEYACTAIDVIARRTRLGFLNVQAADEALPRIVEIMAQHLDWSEERKTVWCHCPIFTPCPICPSSIHFMQPRPFQPLSVRTFQQLSFCPFSAVVNQPILAVVNQPILAVVSWPILPVVRKGNSVVFSLPCSLGRPRVDQRLVRFSTDKKGSAQGTGSEKPITTIMDASWLPSDVRWIDSLNNVRPRTMSFCSCV